MEESRATADGAQPGAAGAPDAAGLIENATALWDDLKGLAHDQLELAALETRRAGESLVTIVICGIVAAVLLIAAWVGICAALVLWLIELGVAPSLSVLAGVLLNVGAAVGLFFAIKFQSKALRFPATVRSLKGKTRASLPAVPAPAAPRPQESPS